MYYGEEDRAPGDPNVQSVSCRDAGEQEASEEDLLHKRHPCAQGQSGQRYDRAIPGESCRQRFGDQSIEPQPGYDEGVCAGEGKASQ